MTEEIRYKKLEVGDERREGDEQRRSPGEEKDYFQGYRKRHVHEFEWHPTDLVGHVILSSDVIVNEFRRPLPF